MKQRVVRAAKAVGVACCVAVFIFSADRIARAQQQSATQAATDAARFTGASRALEPGNLRISHRWFEAGARTAWHRHVEGQLLFVEKGRARVQKRGGPMREMSVGESDYTPPNVDHWHGATPDTEFTQVAVGFSETTEWLEKVTDEQYSGR
jgi:quercetin dioxygenase-like cupin family protein